MRTVPVSDIINFVAAQVGLTAYGSLANLLTADVDSLLQFIDFRAREAWEKYDWNDLTLTDIRAFRNFYNSAATYNEGDQVFDYANTQQYYISLQNGNTGNALPITAPFNNAWWYQYPLVPPNYGYYTGYYNQDLYTPPAWPSNLPIPTVQGIYIDNNQLGISGAPLNQFDAVFGIYIDDPIAVPQPRKVNSYTRSTRGMELLAGNSWFSNGYSGPNQVWMQYRQVYPGFGKFSYQDLSGASQVTAGMVVYDSNTGQAYTANGNGAALPPSSNVGTGSTQWTLNQFPYVLSEYVKQMVFADWIKADGQHDRAQIAYMQAKDAIIREYAKQEEQTGFVRQYNVIGASRFVRPGRGWGY